MTTITNLPDDLAALSDDELSSLHDELVADFDREHNGNSPDVPRLEALAAHVTTVRAEADTRGLTLKLADSSVDVEPASEPVAASSSPPATRRPNLADVARRSPRPTVTPSQSSSGRPVAITAAGERERQLDPLSVAEAMHLAARPLRDGDGTCQGE